MSYFDGFVIPVPSTGKDEFLRHASTVDPVFLEHGALRVVECWGADLKPGETTDFQGAVAAKDDETVAFAWIEWPDGWSNSKRVTWWTERRMVNRAGTGARSRRTA